MKTSLFRIQIAPQHIQYISWILEGYEGLAVVETLDERTGEVLIYGPTVVEAEILAVLSALEDELGLAALVHLAHTIVIESEDAIDDKNGAEDWPSENGSQTDNSFKESAGFEDYYS